MNALPTSKKATILVSVVEMERGLIIERQAEIKHMSRHSIKISKGQIEELLNQGLTAKAVAELLKIGTSTFYKVKASN
ncbi:helix-turn-helix domain-containing protein [Shewanella sp. A14]